MAQTVRQQLKWGVQLGAGICLLGAGISACALPMIKFSPQHLNLDQVGVRATAKVTFKDMTPDIRASRPARAASAGSLPVP